MRPGSHSSISSCSLSLHPQLLEVSAHEGLGDDPLPEDDNPFDATRRPDGFVTSPDQLARLWDTRHDRLFAALVTLFSLGVPCFFINLGLTCLAKFYWSPGASWSGFAAAAAAVAVWLRAHSSAVPHLVRGPADRGRPSSPPPPSVAGSMEMSIGGCGGGAGGGNGAGWAGGGGGGGSLEPTMYSRRCSPADGY